MLGGLPAFSAACTEFLGLAQDINKQRRLNTITLANHVQLMELLEIPQLMDTCVKNRYHLLPILIYFDFHIFQFIIFSQGEGCYGFRVLVWLVALVCVIFPQNKMERLLKQVNFKF